MHFPYPEGTVMDFTPSALPSETLAAIGQVVAASAQTEHAVEMAIGAFLGVDFERAGAITTHMAAPLRDHVLRAVAEIRIEDLDVLDALDTVLDAINAAYAKRNAIVHNSWCIGPDGKVFTVRISARGRYEMDLVEMPVDQIKADAKVIEEAGLDLIKLMMVLDLSPIIPDRLRPRDHKSKAARKKRRKGSLGTEG